MCKGLVFFYARSFCLLARALLSAVFFSLGYQFTRSLIPHKVIIFQSCWSLSFISYILLLLLNKLTSFRDKHLPKLEETLKKKKKKGRSND